MTIIYHGLVMIQKAALVPFMVLLLCAPMRCVSYTPSWHLAFPTCGRDNTTPHTLLPYQFTLWDLAPHKGKGVRLVMVDTGIAGYEFEHTGDYKKHPDIQGHYDPSWGCLSVIEHTHITDTLKNKIETVCPECLPAVKTKDAMKHKCLTHGTHAYGLIVSPTYGLAPDTEVIVINMFCHNGSCNTAMLVRAVEKAANLKPDILLIGANMDENIPINSVPARRLTSLFSQIPWVIIPAGNQGCSKFYISQPAGLAHTICVGAFGITNNTIFVPQFSQRQQGGGPDLLAPGYHITSAGVPYVENQNISQTLSGTSAAAAITASFIALLLGEFRDIYTKDELMEIIHNATWQFDQATPEYNASTYGILDMRLALFIAHVIKQEKKIKPDQVKQHCVKSKNGISFLNTILQKAPNKKLKNKTPHISLQSAIQNCIKHLKN